ncbi:DEKNAAC100139 [Brettanomyces naardenensis]|uniref:DEKNAAC100139 n=1 Tax=Brettanomyces naardenensis TaxID=13370 RepID=A0A448YG04_BRENA|nr:DEKNAAC100139 [Brettanomyces naardenensis]
MAKRMVFDPSHGIQPPSFDQVFGGTNKSTKSSRRDVSYREVNRMIAGVEVPKRPIEPDSCCMSGCVNCVWDLFSEDLEFWKLKTGQAKRALQLQGDNVKEKWPLGFDPPPDGLPDKYIPRELLTRRGNGKKRTELPVGFKVFQDFEKKKKVEKVSREKTLLEETAIPEQDDLRQQARP